MTASPCALMVWGGWAGHQPRETTERFAALLREADYRVEVTDDLGAYEDPARLADTDLIVQCVTMGTLTDAQERGLLDAVRAGTGFAGWHGGAGDSFRDRPLYQFMLGGQFVAHPGPPPDDRLTYTVNITSPDDPITAGLPDFQMHSEQYYLHTDPALEVLATTTFGGEFAPWTAGAVVPVAWKKRWGRGRVYYCALGHDDADFEVPQARELVRRGLLWATRT